MSAAGERATVVIVLVPTVTTEMPHNNEVTTWEPDPIPFWAKYELRRGREFFANGALITQRAARITFDWMDAQHLTEAHRLIVEGVEYNIKVIDKDPDLRRHVVIEAIAGMSETQA